ncbi:MAG: choice-of-anchor D domain-containing protein, partial [Desulfuromonadaceae bacterium]|nr:choice-of-anchor D domain-containing protein [Desulfuromonadaceae bacterium]
PQKSTFGMLLGNVGFSFAATQISEVAATDVGVPSIAFDPVSSRFLVAWEDLRDGTTNQKIYGQLITNSGGLYNVNFPITTATGLETSKQTLPNVSYDSANSRFFVAWQDGRNSQTSSGLDIYGQYVDGDGSLRGQNYAISTAAANQYAPVLAYNSTDQVFLAMWKDARNQNVSGADIYGILFDLGNPALAVLNGDGTPMSPLLIDFGSIRATLDSQTEKTFKLKNVGDSEISITSLSLANGAEYSLKSPAAPIAPIKLAAGTELSVTIELKYLVASAPGSINDSFTVESDGGNATITLQGSAVTSNITVNPTALDFGNVDVGLSAELPFSITNSGSTPINVTSISGLSSQYTIVGTANFTIASGQSVSRSVKFTPTLSGTVSSGLTIYTDVTGATQSVTVTGVGQSGSLTITPSVFDFGAVLVNPGTPPTQEILVTNTGNKAVNINSVTFTNSYFTLNPAAPAAIAAGATESITVTFDPATIGLHSSTMTINSDYGVFTSSLSGTAVGSTLGISTPGGSSFGQIATGTSKTLSVTLSNSGQAPLNITNIT